MSTSSCPYHASNIFLSFPSATKENDVMRTGFRAINNGSQLHYDVIELAAETHIVFDHVCGMSEIRWHLVKYVDINI